VLPLQEGSFGDAVADVQTRLIAAGSATLTDQVGVFGPSTRAVVEAFQRQRGLRIDGIVGQSTWSTLVEAGLKLGDRLLYRSQPMLRGDDVAELQSRLCSLGFDTGRVDGIFGDTTAHALSEFQRNVQLRVDAVVGTDTVNELMRVSGRHQTLELVSMVRERETARSEPPTLRGRHIGIAETGGLGTIAASLNRRLASAGARVTIVHSPEESDQASEANKAAVDILLSVKVTPSLAGCSAAYYSGYSYESTVGRSLAEQVDQAIPPHFGDTRSVIGMTLPILRETRMPTVVIELGPVETVVEHTAELADALAHAVTLWAEERSGNLLP
jgi:N-acetylmuramoyl-L-alanine amidase